MKFIRASQLVAGLFMWKEIFHLGATLCVGVSRHPIGLAATAAASKNYLLPLAGGQANCNWAGPAAGWPRQTSQWEMTCKRAALAPAVPLVPFAVCASERLFVSRPPASADDSVWPGPGPRLRLRAG